MLIAFAIIVLNHQPTNLSFRSYPRSPAPR